jgi:hypothetical protein
MSSPVFANPRWAIGVVLDVTVAALAIRHRLYRNLPWFTAYLATLASLEIVAYVIGVKIGYTSRVYFYSFWMSQSVFIAMRGIVVVELCRRILGPYVGVWRLCRLILAGVYGTLLIVAGVMAYRSESSTLTTFITTTERGLELAIVGTLVFAILFTRYYRIAMENVTALVTGGLILYSGIQVINTELFRAILGSYFGVYSEIRTDSFIAAMLIWLVAAWKPVAVAERPRLLGAEVYSAVMPEMNLKLRQLNNRLTEILK